MQKKILLMLFAVLGLTTIVQGQSITKRVLFLGNSYTSVNDLPQMIADVANSTGDTLIFDSNTPGGCTLMQHSTNATSLAKIASGNWDYVVLQEQSQLPSFPISQVEVEVFPYARALDSIINNHNPCTETVFYMTWGRKNGDAQNCASWPPVCTYNGMDSLMNLRYRMMADSNKALLSPVGAVWKYIRTNFPSIELYQADESHPSVAGTYTAACCFYAALFRKDPTLIAFNSALSATDAASIRTAVKMVVFDNLMEWHIGEYDPWADFTYTDLGSGQIAFANHSVNASTYLWNFGDGNTSSQESPSYSYSTNGVFEVTLFAYRCGTIDSVEQTIYINTVSIQPQKCIDNLNIYPNPANHQITIHVAEMPVGAVYRIYNYIGETVLVGKIDTKETVIDIKDLPNGVYMIEISDGLKQIIKFVRE